LGNPVEDATKLPFVLNRFRFFHTGRTVALLSAYRGHRSRQFWKMLMTAISESKIITASGSVHHDCDKLFLPVKNNKKPQHFS